jgi:protein gp37
MADKSNIEWTDATWNPITGCSIASPGCADCYAMKLAGTRLRNHPSRKGLTQVVNGKSVWTGELRFNEKWLRDPVKWREPRGIFVCAHSDLFHPNVPEEWIARTFDVMIEAPQHRYHVLTKRGDRMAALLDGPKTHRIWHRKLWHRSVLPNVILGVSVENQAWADARRPHLARLAACGWATFCSYEPALGAVNFAGWEFLHQLISGGENGKRPSHPDWHRAARDWCAANNVPFFFKQHGSWTVIVDRERDDPDWRADYAVVNRKPDYRILNLAGGFGFHGERVLLMRRVGKKRAGRVLDGAVHDGAAKPFTAFNRVANLEGAIP